MKLEVGKTYRNRIGRSKKIVEAFLSLKGERCFRDNEKIIYGEDGRINPLRSCPDDLISEVIPVSQSS